MAFDTFVVFVGTYPDLESAEADYELVKELHSKEGLMDAYDAAVLHRRDDGKVKIAHKHETPTRVGGVLGGGRGWPPGSSSRCSRSRRSAAGCSRRRRSGERSWGRWPATRPPG